MKRFFWKHKEPFDERQELLEGAATTANGKRTLAHLPVIPFYKKVLFGLPLLLENFIRFFHHMFIKLYFVEHMKKLDAFSWASAVETASLFIVMPIVGYMLDAIKGGRFGRRLPALLIFIPAFTMTCVPMSVLPGDSLTDLETSAWFKFWSFLHNLFGQTWHVVYLALALGLTDDFDERSTLFLIGGLSATLGGLGGASLPAYIAQSDYVYLMVGASCLFFTTALLAAFVLRETAHPPAPEENVDELLVNHEGKVAETPNQPNAPPEEEEKMARMGLVPSLSHCFRNHPYVILWILMLLSYATISPTLPLVLTYGFGVGKSELSDLTIASMGASVVGSLFWLWASVKLGKKVSMQLGLVGMALSLIIVLFVPTNGGGWVVWLFVTIPQFFYPAVHDLNKAMLADVVDYDQFLWGKKERREGIFTVILQGIPVGSFAQSLILAVLVLIGLDLHSKKQSAFTEHWLQLAVLFGIVPHILGAILLFWYPITTSVHEAILHGISERIYSQAVPIALSVTPVLDPITGKYLSIIPQEDAQTEILDHFAVWELRLWLRMEGGKEGRGIWTLRSILFTEFLACLGGLGGLLYLAVEWGMASDYFVLLILSASVLLVAALLQFMRIIATRKLQAECTREVVSEHIEQLRQLYA